MQIETTSKNIATMFENRFYSSPFFMFRAPGRANIIGEHVDYSGDFAKRGVENYALPIALPFQVCVALKEVFGKGKDVISVHSANFGQKCDFRPDEIPGEPVKDIWMNHMFGVFAAAREQGLTINPGLQILIAGDVPIGSGISSSAALSVSLIMALRKQCGWKLDDIGVAKLAQASEHHKLVGTKCGLLDQLASIFAQKDRAILLNFGNMTNIESVILSQLTGNGYKFLLVDSGVSRELGGTYYNDRRAELEVAGRIMGRNLKGKPYVSAYTSDDFRTLEQNLATSQKCLTEMEKTSLRRAKYVLEEKARVSKFVEDARKGNIRSACGLIDETGAGLSMDGDFQVSATVLKDAEGHVSEERPYMDFLREILIRTITGSKDYLKQDRPFGFRLMGGGGGGCQIGLMPAEYDTPSFRQTVEAAYLKEQEAREYGTDYKLKFYEATPSEGAGEMQG